MVFVPILIAPQIILLPVLIPTLKLLALMTPLTFNAPLKVLVPIPIAPQIIVLAVVVPIPILVALILPLIINL